jgi:hypothetical protein
MLSSNAFKLILTEFAGTRCLIFVFQFFHLFIPNDRQKPEIGRFFPLGVAVAVIYSTTGATLRKTRLHIFKHGYLTTYTPHPTRPPIHRTTAVGTLCLCRPN